MKKELLTRAERLLIAEAVAKAESATSGEITTALIPESSDYAFFELGASVVFGVLLSMIQLLFYPVMTGVAESLVWNAAPWHSSMLIGIISLTGGGLFYFFSNIPAVDRLIIPRKVLQERVRARALRHFTESGVYATEGGTGILIFVSLMERRVELIADRGIDERIGKEVWSGIVEALGRKIAAGELAAGLEEAVLSCGELLSREFPIAEDDENELSDDIVILEE